MQQLIASLNNLCHWSLSITLQMSSYVFRGYRKELVARNGNITFLIRSVLVNFSEIFYNICYDIIFRNLCMIGGWHYCSYVGFQTDERKRISRGVSILLQVCKTESYSETCQTSKIEWFAKIIVFSQNTVSWMFGIAFFMCLTHSSPISPFHTP